MALLEKTFESQLEKLDLKDQEMFRKLKHNVFGSYNKFIKPIVIAILTFTIFTKMKGIIGWQDTIFVLCVTIVIYLRLLVSKFP